MYCAAPPAGVVEVTPAPVHVWYLPSPTLADACCDRIYLRQARCPRRTHPLPGLYCPGGQLRLPCAGGAARVTLPRGRSSVGAFGVNGSAGGCKLAHDIIIVSVVGAPLPDRTPDRFRIGAPLLWSERT